MKKRGEGSGCWNKKDIGLPQFPYTGAFDEVPDEFFDELFSQQSQVTQVNVQVGNENVGTVEVPVHSQIAENVVHEEDTEKESSEEEDSEEDTYVEGRRWRIEDSGDESDKEIYETDNDAALDDNDLFDANIQSKFGGVGNTYLPKDFVAFEDEEDSDGNNSEKGFHSPNNSSSEEGERRRKYPEFCKSDLNNPKFEKGMLFGSKEDLKTALKNYSVMGNYAIKFVKNDKRRLTAKCKNCTWMLHASVMQLEQTLQIKSFNDKHTCLRTPTNPHVNSVDVQSHSTIVASPAINVAVNVQSRQVVAPANAQRKKLPIKRRSNVNPPNSFNPPRTSCSKK
ncbi:hypothetical protein ACE6H2_007926 [Prunus campanulata]